MINPDEAVDPRKPYLTVGGVELCPNKLFTKEEAERAERIVAELEGLTIYSAQELLRKIDCYLLQSLVTVSENLCKKREKRWE